MLHHEYEGALPTGTLAKGLRLRAGNIQVGGHNLLEDLFPEPRFQQLVSRRSARDRPPNCAQRSSRSTSSRMCIIHNLVNHLTPTARDIARRCRTSSVRRKWEREFELYAQSVAETIDIIVQGSVNRAKREQLALSVEQTLLRMSKIAGRKLLQDYASELETRIVALRERLSAAMNEGAALSSPLMRVPEGKRKTYEHFFELVYECSTNRVAAKALIDRILLRIE